MEGGARPTGTVTFLFTDVEGSTGLWEREPAAMEGALARHDGLLRDAIVRHGGYVFSTAGDAFAAVFTSPGHAGQAATDAQAALAAETWLTSEPIRVRMALHAGEAAEREGNYYGPTLNRAARLMAAAHGGQVLVSDVAAQLLGREDLLDLGEHRLKDLSAPERVWQLGVERHPPIRTLERRLHNLPVQHGELVGRAAAVADIAELCSRHRLVSLLGLGGAGKTRLALATAAELVDGFPDGVWFVDLVPVQDGAQLPEAMADAAGLRLVAGTSPARLSSALAARSTLFVLDNCEHLTAAVAELVDLLLDTTGINLLVTSREPLDLPDEWPYRVGPLAVDERLEAPAVAVFAGAAARCGVELVAADVVEAAAVCRHLDGLPLALELAGAQLRSLSLSELSARLDRRFELLERNRRGRRQRQASLFGVLEDTWSALGPDERELLRQLAAFVGGFDVATVEAIGADLTATDVVHTLGNLVDRSLVVQDADGLRLLETVKLFTQRHWPDGGGFADYTERHTAWALDHIRAYSIEDRHTSFELAVWAARQYDELRAIEARLFEQARTSDLVDLVSAHNFGIGYGPVVRAMALTERTDRYLASGRFTEPEAGRLHLLIALAAVATRDAQRLVRHGELAIEMLGGTSRDHDLAMARDVTALGVTRIDRTAGLALFDQAIELADATGAPRIAAFATGYRTIPVFVASRGRDQLTGLAALSERMDQDRYDAAHSIFLQISIVRQFVTDPAGARGASDRLWNLQSAIGVQVSEPWLAFRAVTSANLGDIDVARDELAALRSESRRNGDHRRPDILVPVAVLAWRLGRADLARRWLTTIRYSDKPLFDFVFTGVFLQVRTVIGLDQVNPLATLELDTVMQEALDWLDEIPRTPARVDPV